LIVIGDISSTEMYLIPMLLTRMNAAVPSYSPTHPELTTEQHSSTL